MSKEHRKSNEIAAALRVNSAEFLESQEWRAMRAMVLDAYGVTCMKCGREPGNKRQPNVDHIRPRKRFPHLALEFNNLQVLCGRCNKKKGNDIADYRSRWVEMQRPITVDALPEDQANHMRDIAAGF